MMIKESKLGTFKSPEVICRLILLLVICSLPVSAATLNVTHYGAVPDDSGDDRNAINNTINAASSGDTVFFPAGTYHVSGSITGKTGVRLEGASGAVLLYVGTSADVILNLVGMSNVTVTGLTLDGNNSALVTQGIWAADGSGIRLENLTIQNIGNTSTWGPHGILFGSSVTDSTITNNTITNVATGTSWGAGIRLAHGSSRNLIENNTIANTGRGGILCNNDCTDIIVRDNTVSGSGGEGLGIELWVGCDRGIVEDNHIDHWLSIALSDYCAVRRNTISDKSGVYKFIGIEGISQNSIYTDNLVDDGSHLGISLSGDVAKDYAIWARNTINKSSTWGVQFQGENVGCAYHYFYQNKFLNTNRDQPPALYAYQGYGFRFNGNCHYISFEENEFSNNEGGGIQPGGGSLDQISFVNNRITDNAYESITDYFGDDLEWEGNTVSGNGTNRQLTSRGFVNNKPVAAFTSPTTVQTGEIVSFVNTSYDPDGSIGHVLWDFGDGIPSTDLNPTHIYEKSGTYTVSLVVWDNDGRGNIDTKLVTCHAQAAVVTQYSLRTTYSIRAAGGSVADNLSVATGGGTASYAAGVIGQAVSFDQAAGLKMLEMADSEDDIAAYSAWTIELFVKPTTVCNDRVCRSRSFTSTPTPNRTCKFPSIRLSRYF